MKDGRPLNDERQNNAGKKVAVRAGGHLRSYGRLKGNARKAFPDHWSFLLGEICLYSFVVLVVTGIYLAVYFHPSAQMVRYEGSYAPLRGHLVSEAFNSSMRISFELRGGLLIRQAHHWAALIFVGSILVHLMRVFFTGAFRKPRRLSWLVGFLLLVLAMFEGLTGYDLPDDLLSGTGLAVVNGTILSIPFVGSYLSLFLFGGEFPGHELIAHFHLLHVWIIPALMVFLIAVYIWLAIRTKHTQYPGSGRTEKNVVGLPFTVHAVKSAGFFLLVAGAVFAIAGAVQINPIWRYGPFRPDQVSAGSQPDWYMGVADGLLRVMPGWEISLLGRTLALDNLIPLGVAGGLFLAMAVYPFIESWLTSDDREQHILDRPRNRPVRTALGVAWISFYLVALIAAANDIIAVRLHVSVESVTWAVRFGLFLVPLTAFSVTKRVALGLQRRDRDKVLHGRETGIIKRLPDGEFVEIHEPLGPDELHLLTQHTQYRPIDPASAKDGVQDGVGRALARRLRADLSRRLYGEGTQVPKPSEQEYKEITGEHRP
ncbi:ubiquinol-cytochrome c reductase cytochrome b subunit [Streptomyces sp. AcH 505]|uniref:cytochrome bc1 complex cytochrome b subunit n=1 Tax=Streptomyces sp. AcH 505 TaxID=352211 RepID=UPI0005A91E6C